MSQIAISSWGGNRKLPFAFAKDEIRAQPGPQIPRLKKMSQFAKTFSNDEILSQPVIKISWAQLSMKEIK